MSSSIKTFAVSLSPEMAPTSTVVIYSVAREGEVVVDSLTFPVNGISKNNVNIYIFVQCIASLHFLIFS